MSSQTPPSSSSAKQVQQVSSEPELQDQDQDHEALRVSNQNRSRQIERMASRAMEHRPSKDKLGKEDYFRMLLLR